MKKYMKITSFLLIILLILQLILPVMVNIKIGVSYAVSGIQPTKVYYNGTSRILTLQQAHAPTVDTDEAMYRYYGSRESAYVKHITTNGKTCLALNYRSAIVVMNFNFNNIGAIGVTYIPSGNDSDGASMGIMPNDKYQSYISATQTDAIREERNNWMKNNYYTMQDRNEHTYYVNTQKVMGENYFYIGAYGDGQGAAANVKVKAIYIYPKLTVTDPSSVTRNIGSTATFSVTSNGDTFQWYRNGVAISGATSSSYTRTVTSSDSGSTYYCKVSDSSFGDQKNVVYVNSNSATITIPTYTVSYHANSGVGSVASSSFKGGASTIIASGSGLSKEGYTFNGWNTKADGTGTSYIAGNTYTNNQNITLYAQWQREASTLRVDPNGGIFKGNTTATDYINSYNTTIEIPIPTRTGYRFTGWTRTNHYGTLSSTTSDAIYTYGETNNVMDIITATWEVNPYNLQVKPNGGVWDGKTEDQSFTINYGGTKIISVPTRTGYSFTKWALAGEGSKMSSLTANNATFTMGSANAILTADWERNNYNLVVNPNGGTWNDNTNSQTFSIAYEGTKSIVLPTRTGYTFTGWTLAGEGSTMSSLMEDNATFTMGYANATLTANWSINTSTLKVNPNGGSWNGSSAEQSFIQNYNTTKSIPIPTRTGYTFKGWTRTGNYGSLSSTTSVATYTYGATNNVTDVITATWEVNPYNLQIKPNGGVWDGKTEDQSFTINYGGTKIIPVPTRTGYTFTGWTLAGEGSKMSSLIVDNATFTMGYANAILIANWKLIKHDMTGTVTWNDEEDKYVSRPLKVDVTLNSDEEVTEIEQGALETPTTKTVAVTNTTSSYGFENLQTTKIKDNTNYKYTVMQNKVLGYETIVTGYDITNNLILPSYTSQIVTTPQHNLESEFVKNEQVQIVGIVTASESNREKVGTCKEEVSFVIDNGIEINRDSIKVTYIDKEGNTKEVSNFRLEGNIIKVSFESNREKDNTAGDSLKIETKGTLKEVKQYRNTISYTGYLRDYKTGEDTNIHLGTLTTASKNITVGKVSIGIKEINEENEMTRGSEFEIRKKETGEVVQRFTTEGKEEILRKLEPMVEYVAIETKPIAGYTTADEAIFILNEQGEIVIESGAEKEGNTIIIEDHKTRLQVEVKEEGTSQYVVGPKWQIIRKTKEEGQTIEEVMVEWTSEGKEKQIEKLPIGEYIIREIDIGENTGYVTIEDKTFRIEDTKELQKLEVEQKVSKVQIHIKNEDSKEYNTGTTWQLIDKERQNVVKEWLANGEAYRVEKLPVGVYILKEIAIGENTGYVTNEEQEINIVDTREIQEFEVEQNISKIQIHIKDEDDREYSIGSKWQLIDKEEQKVIREWTTNGEVCRAEKVPVGEYILKEVSIGESTGYVTNEEQEINIVDTREVQHFEVEQKISNIQIHIKDEDSKEYSIGSIWQLIGKEKQNIVREWTTNGEAYYLEKVPVGEYILKEVGIGESTGYVTNKEQEISIIDVREMQDYEIEQKISKVRIHLKDMKTEDYVEGAILQIIQKHERDGKVEEKVIREWTTGQEGKLEQRLPVGEYIIREVKLPENSGYATIEEKQIKIIDTLEEQQVELRQDVTKIKIEIIDEETKEKIENVEVEIIEKETGKIIKLEETEEGYVGERIPIGDYIIREKTPDGYKEVKDIEMKVEDTAEIQTTRTENKRLIYDMQVEKELTSITINGEKKLVPKGEMQKVEVKESKIKTSDIRLEYVIRVSNVGETKATIGKIIDNIPEGFQLISRDWKQEGRKAIYNAEKEELEANESKEVRIELKWENKESNFGEKKNTAQLQGSTNPYGYEDKTTDNNIGEEITIFSIKTGLEGNQIMLKMVIVILLTSIIISFIVGTEIIILKRKE